MTVRNILAAVAGMTESEQLSDQIAAGAPIEGDDAETVKKMLRSLSLALAEFSSGYVMPEKEETVSGGEVPFSSLAFYPVAITGAAVGGKDVPFTVGRQSVSLPVGAGAVTLRYKYIPTFVAAGDDLPSFGAKVNANVFVYGTAANYCAARGRYDEAANYDSAYKSAAEDCLTCAPKRIKRRLWGL